MRKTSVSSSSSSFGGFLSPGAPPSYTDNNKGWSSERVPHPSSSSSTSTINAPRRRIGSASALTTPFYGGRGIPSKWEDAERWICSPAVTTNPQRRQKSKSGPIAPPPPALPHPRMTMMMRAVEAPPQGNSKKGLMVVGSPFSTGVLEAERVFRGSVGGGHGHSQSCADLMSEEETSSLSSKTDTEEKEEVITRRDIATQMTPNNNHHSPQELSVSVIEPPPCRVGGGEVREVKMDKGARLIKHPKRRVMSSSSRIIRRDHQPEAEPNSASWDISEPAMTLFKLHREEAKIAAWENLQKAKAEAAMRKLEVKLEKKKTASMDKILNKLQTAKLKAQDMRRSTTVSSGDHGKEEQISRNSAKITTHLVRRHTFMSPFMTCFAPRVDCRKSSSAL
ncbi:unnamed protein product [Brassica rapa]|uniref:Remorin C-terminal domain-containing protein n=1 Tax=Brassica campestris TaxID=3711 RepID=A0A3P6A3V1_BRACM|nr:unnamed protein product [Brassica rapa]VDC84329.1 unnamed protein product [Brassica rapa]